MKESKYTLFFQYLRGHLNMLMAGAICLVITLTVFYLYALPLESVLYAALLCTIFLLIFFAATFGKYVKKHEQLKIMEAQAGLELGEFPPATALNESDYQRIVEKLHRQHMERIAQDDQARTEMIDYYTMWAHQIKTPIAAMDLLLKANDSQENIELLAELFKIEQYVDMVLSYLRLDSNTTDYIIKPTPLCETVRQCIRKYARIFVLKKIRLEFDAEEFYVLTDEKWLSFVVEQLLSNALKYTSSGTITITIDQKPPALLIKDTGIGIRPEDLPRIFDKGFTGYNGRSGQKSTGLGLYLCKRILEKLSHTITIESVPGQGTCVRIGLDTYKNERFPREM